MGSDSADLSRATTAYHFGNLDEAAALVARLRNSADRQIVIDAHTLSGRIAYAQRSYATARDYFLISAEMGCDYRPWLYLGRTAAQLDDLPLTEHAFTQTLTHLDQSVQHPLAINFEFAAVLAKSGLYEVALAKLAPLRDHFATFDRLDRDFTFRQKLPDFFEFVDLAATTLGAQQNDKSTAWLAPLIRTPDVQARLYVQRIMAEARFSRPLPEG